MGFSEGNYAKLWEIKPITSKSGKTNYVGRLTVSSKDQKGEYRQDFGAYVAFYGDAAEKAKTLKGTERIKIINSDLKNNYDKEKKVTYWSPILYDFEVVEGTGSGGSSQRQARGKSSPKFSDFGEVNDSDGGELPFN